MPRRPKLALPKPEPSYTVGHGKPPVATRFQPGQSGNPKGRPKGARNKAPALNIERLKEIVLAEAYRTIKVNDGPRQVTVPMAQAVMRSLALNAVKGHHRAQRLFSELVTATERSNKALHDDWLNTAIAYKTGWENELYRRARSGIVLPAPLPHPDDIVIDMKTGGVIIKGPMTKEEVQTWTELSRAREEAATSITILKAELVSPKNAKYRVRIRGELDSQTDLHQRITAAIGQWPKRND